MSFQYVFSFAQVVSIVTRKFYCGLVEIYYGGVLWHPLVPFQRSGRKGSRAAMIRYGAISARALESK